MAGAATVAAAGSIAWYTHQFGNPLHAMTPAEEGSVQDNPEYNYKEAGRLT